MRRGLLLITLAILLLGMGSGPSAPLMQQARRAASIKAFLWSGSGTCPGSFTGPTAVTTARSGSANVNCAGTTTAINANTARVDATGLLVEATGAEKFLNNCTTPATQTITLTAVAHTSWIEGTGNVVITAGTATSAQLPCTVTDASPCHFTVTAGTVVATVNGSVTFASVMSLPYKASKLCIAGSSATRNQDNVTVANPIPSGKPWCISAKLAPTESWAFTGTRGIFLLGTYNTANSVVLSTYNSAPQCVTNDSLNATRSRSDAAFTAGTAAKVVSCCSGPSSSTLYVDGAPGVNVASGTGAGVITTQPSMATIGGATGYNFGGNFEWYRICYGSNDPAKCGQVMKTRVDCVGDSITATVGTGLGAWPAQVGVSLGSRWVVFNRGVTGYTTDQALTKYRAEVKADSVGPRRMMILIGVNDVKADVTAITAYANITTMITEAQADGVTKIVLGTVMPFKGLGAWSAPREAQRIALNNLIAATPGVTVLDTAAAFADPNDSQALNPAYDSGDHLHINDAGRVVMAALVAAAIQ